MYLDTEKLVNFCALHKLTLSQIFIATLLYRKQFPSIMKYGIEVEVFSEYDIEHLKDNGFLLDMNKNNERHLDLYVVTDKFLSAIGIELSGLSDYLWDNYPSWVSVGTSRFKGRNISPEETEILLNKKLLRGRLHPNTYQDIINALNEQKEAGNLGMALRAWIETEQWKLEKDDYAEHGEDI